MDPDDFVGDAGGSVPALPVPRSTQRPPARTRVARPSAETSNKRVPKGTEAVKTKTARHRKRGDRAAEGVPDSPVPSSPLPALAAPKKQRQPSARAVGNKKLPNRETIARQVCGALFKGQAKPIGAHRLLAHAVPKCSPPQHRSRGSSEMKSRHSTLERTECGTITPVIRYRCREWMASKLGSSVEGDQDETHPWLKALEEAVFCGVEHDDTNAYRRKVHQLAYNLATNGANLLAHEAAEVASMTDAQLAEGTPMQMRARELEEQTALCRAMMADTNIYANSDDLPAIVRCYKCKRSDHISYVWMQIRSADEPPTVLAMCTFPGCNTRWKLRG